MDEENKVINFGRASTKPSSASKPAGTQEATKAAQMILSCYPDFGKAPPEYIVNLIDVLASYPSHILPKLCNLRDGIPARCQYVPTVADIVQMADGIMSMDETIKRMTEDENQRRVQAEKRSEWWAGRQAALVKAKEKYKTAFLDVNGDLRYVPDLEKGEPVPEDMVKFAKSKAGAVE